MLFSTSLVLMKIKESKSTTMEKKLEIIEEIQEAEKGPGYMNDRKIVVGRLSTHIDYGYHSLQVDEMAFFNETLSEEQIRILNL